MAAIVFKRRRFALGVAALALAACGKSEQPPQPQAADPAPISVSDGEFDPTRWPKLDTAGQLSAEIETRIDGIMSRMTLEQKVGQVIQADSDAITPEEMRRYRLGSVLSGGNSAPGDKPYATIDDWVASLDALFDAAIDAEGVDVVIPPIFGIDAVHGHNNVIGGTVFPHNIGLGAMRDPALIREIAQVTARELRATGHEWTFAPTVAVPRDDRWGRTYEGYSEDPSITAQYAGEIVVGLQSEFGAPDFLGPERVLSTAKHFLADGGTDAGKDQGDAHASEEDLVRIHAAGYPPAIEAGALSIMASFSSWNGKKIHGEKYLLTDVLKDRMGFQGFVVGDWNAHGQVPGCANDNCPASINAGLDMYMAPDSWRALFDNTLASAKSGEIPMARLDDAVRRILRAKIRMGLFEAGKPSSRPLAGDPRVLGAPEHRAVARRAVRQSLVLLKNNDALLPLRRDQKVLIAGDGADDISKQSGGWTLSWQGGGMPNDLFPNGQSIGAGIAEIVRAGGGEATIDVAGGYQSKPDVAIVVFGEDPYAEFQGDRPNVGYSLDDDSDLALLKRLRADGVKVVGVFLSGRPLWVNPHLNASDAFVAAWLPGTEGGGVADVLFRDNDGGIAHDFSGKLSFSWPRSAAQTPLNVGDENYDPLFAFGYGASYADDAALAALPEDPGVSVAGSTDGVYFAGGQARAPWSLVAEGGGSGVTIASIDHKAQEDGFLLTFPDDAPSTAAIVGEQPVDYSRETNAALELAFAYKVVSPPSGATSISVRCGEGCAGALDVSTSMNGETGWREARLSLSCFRDAGADMAAVSAPFVVTSQGGAIGFASVRLAQDEDGVPNCWIMQ